MSKIAKSSACSFVTLTNLVHQGLLQFWLLLLCDQVSMKYTGSDKNKEPLLHVRRPVSIMKVLPPVLFLFITQKGTDAKPKPEPNPKPEPCHAQKFPTCYPPPKPCFSGASTVQTRRGVIKNAIKYGCITVEYALT